MVKKWLLGNESRVIPAGVFWNTLGGIFNAGQSALILVFVSYSLDVTVSGLVSIAFATANLFMSLAKYGVRNFQVTDARADFSFGDYFYARLLSLAGTMLSLGIYLGIFLCTGEYSLEKALIVLEVCILKLVDAMEDVYAGDYQRQGRLDIASKIMTARMVLSTAVICLLLVVRVNIGLAFFIGLAVSVLVDFYCIWQVRTKLSCPISSGRLVPVGRLLKSCLPLCIGSTLSIYIGNAPKFMIDRYMDETIQGIFGYMMMPVFVITLLNNFLYQPVIQKMGVLWEKQNRREFAKRIYFQVAMLSVLTVCILVGGGLVGLPILSWLYNTDLTAYRVEFLVLLLGGSLYAFAYYLTVILTTIRKQNMVAMGYLIVVAFNLFGGKWFVSSNGVMGACKLYVCSNLLLAVVYILVLLGSGFLKKDSLQAERI